MTDQEIMEAELEFIKRLQLSTEEIGRLIKL